MGQQNPIAVTLGKAAGSSAQSQASFGKQGDFLASALHGSKYLSNYGGNLFAGANQTGVTTSAGLATTYVGICLSNPAANTKALALRRLSGQFIVAPSTVTGLGLITGWSAAGVVTHTTPITALGCSNIGLGGASPPAPTAKLDAACTIVGTPVWWTWFAETLVATDLPAFTVDLEGAVIIQPGGYAAIGTTIAGPASGFVGGIEWEEWPI